MEPYEAGPGEKPSDLLGACLQVTVEKKSCETPVPHLSLFLSISTMHFALSHASMCCLDKGLERQSRLGTAKSVNQNEPSLSL